MRFLVATLAVVGACQRASEPAAVEVAPTPPTATNRSGPTDTEGAAPLPRPRLADLASDACLEGLKTLDASGVCFLEPDFDVRPRRLVIYLPGIMPPVFKSPQQTKVQGVVVAAARKVGAGVLLPRGRRGIGPKDSKDWWAWPTDPGDHETYARAIVAEWQAAKATLEAAWGPFDRVYLAGSSSGAYFLAALALRGAFDADGFAAASGGAPGFAGTGKDAPRRPFYIGYATGDPTNKGPEALATFLTAKGWPVQVSVKAGGHGARQDYLDEAFAFWASFERDGGPR